MTQAESSGVKQQNKKKQKKESAWRPEGPKDPFAMVCVKEPAENSVASPLWKQRPVLLSKMSSLVSSWHRSMLSQRRSSRRSKELSISFPWAKVLPGASGRPGTVLTASGRRSQSPGWVIKLKFLSSSIFGSCLYLRFGHFLSPGEPRRSIPVRVVPVSSPARRAVSESIHQINFVKCGNMCFYNTDCADDGVVTHGPLIEAEGCVRTEPFSLPDRFTWDNLDLSSQAVVSFCCRPQKLQFPNQEERLWKRQPDRGKLNKASPFQLKELCSLLNENYLEEDDNTVRFDFSPEYLQWWASRGRICSIRTLSVNGFLFLCPCSLSCRACARIQVFPKDMNHSLWQTADEYHQNSNQWGYHRSVLFDAPHPQNANLQLSWILIYLRTAIEYAENQVFLFC